MHCFCCLVHYFFREIVLIVQLVWRVDVFTASIFGSSAVTVAPVRGVFTDVLVVVYVLLFQLCHHGYVPTTSICGPYYQVPTTLQYRLCTYQVHHG